MKAARTTRYVLLSTIASTAMLLPAVALAQRAGQAGGSPSVVVAAFETDRTGWMPPPRFGETLSELLTARLSSEGIRVIDRGWLAGSSSELPDTPVARLAGSGVDYIVLGSVTRLSLERHSSSGLGILPTPIVGGLVRRSKTETGISLTVRVVNARTGEILRSVTAEGSSDRKQTSGGGVALVGKVPVLGGRRSSATGIHDRLLEEALEQAMAVVAAEIVAATAPRGTPGQPEADRF